jgi:hypothetical protein
MEPATKSMAHPMAKVFPAGVLHKHLFPLLDVHSFYPAANACKHFRSEAFKWEHPQALIVKSLLSDRWRQAPLTPLHYALLVLHESWDALDEHEDCVADAARNRRYSKELMEVFCVLLEELKVGMKNCPVKRWESSYEGLKQHKPKDERRKVIQRVIQGSFLDTWKSNCRLYKWPVF